MRPLDRKSVLQEVMDYLNYKAYLLIELAKEIDEMKNHERNIGNKKEATQNS